MKQHAFTIDLKDGPAAVAAYRRYHAEPWPEVVAALRAVGIEELQIWLLGRRLFMLLTAGDDFDPATDVPRYLDLHPRCRTWEDLMGTFQQPVPEAAPGEKWAPMDSVFTLSDH